MKRIRLVAIMCLCSVESFALNFNDGNIHNIDYEIVESIRVDDGCPGMGTTLNIIEGGIIAGESDVTALNDCYVNLAGGYIGDFLQASDRSIVTITSGIVNRHLFASDNSQVSILGGIIENDLVFGNHSTIYINGGEIKTHLRAEDESVVFISGGQFGKNYNGDAIYALDQSRITVSGGILDNDTYFLARHDSKIIIKGVSFNLDYGIYKHSDFPSGGHISGTLLNGDIIDHNFEIEDNAELVLIPEPCTLALLAIGGLALRKRRF